MNTIELYLVDPELRDALTQWPQMLLTAGLWHGANTELGASSFCHPVMTLAWILAITCPDLAEPWT
jgi:hypothetical protein